MPSINVSAAVARAPHAPLSIESLELDEPRADEILVRLVATGVCHTDIAMRDQTYPVPQPIVLGHEGAGIVERVGAGIRSVSPGDHVLMTYNSCGACRSCLATATSYCYDFFGLNFSGSRPDRSTLLASDGTRVHGNFFGQSSFATYALSNARNTITVPADLPLERLGPLACGVQTGAGAVLNSLHVKAGSSFAVFGSGSVGLSAVLAARVARAATIIAVDKVDSRLALARELGATHAINANETNLVEAIKEIDAGGVDFALDTTGIPSVIRQAVDSLAPRGRCAILGASPVGSELSLDAVHLMTGGRHVFGTVEGDSTPHVFIPRLLDLYRHGRFPFDRLLQSYRFDHINEAIADTEAGRVVKPVLLFGDAQ